jgi:hypothetical protein
VDQKEKVVKCKIKTKDYLKKDHYRVNPIMEYKEYQDCRHHMFDVTLFPDKKGKEEHKEQNKKLLVLADGRFKKSKKH